MNTIIVLLLHAVHQFTAQTGTSFTRFCSYANVLS